MVVFNIDDNAHENMEKAFKDEEADERKEWLKQYNPNARTFDLDSPNKILQLDISTFINEELIKFSIEDCKRSLPHLIDGQKESQRKVIFGLKQWNGKNNIKVAQLGAFVAQKQIINTENKIYLTLSLKWHKLLLEPITYLF